MSYGTMLYAIDLDVLQAAIGGGDLGLAKKIAAMEEASAASLKRKQLRIQICEDGMVLIDGKQGDLPAAIAAYSTLLPSELCLYQGRNPGLQKELFEALEALSTSRRMQVAKVYFYPAHATEAEFWADPDELPKYEKQPLAKAVQALVNGTTDKRIKASDYGYALERLCRALGQPLNVDDAIADMDGLRLDSPLAKARTFQPVPQKGDFPVISYLTANEVQLEAERLERMDLAFPEDEEIEQGRRSFSAAITAARERGLGVMAFYY